MNSEAIPPQMPVTPKSSDLRLFYELLSLTAFVFPLGQILGPLVLWLVKKDGDPVADAEGKKVINFNISWTLWGIASCGLGFIAWIIIDLIAIIKAANKEPFNHPWTIKFLK